MNSYQTWIRFYLITGASMVGLYIEPSPVEFSRDGRWMSVEDVCTMCIIYQVY
jgi:hypothetical protein